VAECGWGDRSWHPGDVIADGDVPADVLRVFIRRRVVEPIPAEDPPPPPVTA
jgi:hypothetical protein